METDDAESKNTEQTDIPSLELLKADNSGAKTLVWTDLTITVPIQRRKRNWKFWKNEIIDHKIVLNQVSGVAMPGELLAIMGPSGCGKTVLLNTLTGIDQKGINFAGDVNVNGEKLSSFDMRRVSAYVQQEDMFIGTLTVKEQLTFSAMLRMGPNNTQEDRIRRVDEVLKDLGLTRCENTLIGVANRVKGISCGESKRLAFACEILTDPPILFCDEPTSGLDSFMAIQVVNCLREMARKGKTIITTIHQPSSQVFNMFDKICFMAIGQISYFGPSSEVCNFWKGIGLECPATYNPADHVIKSLSIADNERQKCTEQILMIRTKYEESQLGMKMYRKTHGLGSRQNSVGNKDLKERDKYTAGWFTQFSVLFVRSFLTTLRDPLLLKVKLIQVLATAIVIGVVNLRTEVTGPTVMNMEGILYNTVRDMNFMFLFPSVNVITSELPIFMREYRSGIYRVEAYYFAKSCSELPQYVVLPLIYSFLVYFMSGLYESVWSFFIYSSFTILLTFVAISIAYAGACVFGEDSLALTYMPCFILPMLVFGGFYISFHSIPSYFVWLSYASWFRYGFEALEINQWRNYDAIPGCENFSMLQQTNNDYCPARSGIGILTRRGMKTDYLHMGANFLMLIFMFILFRIIGLIALIFRIRLAS